MGIEKILKLDIIPRIIEGTEWATIENGLKQRIKALNLFIHDIYHDQKVVKDGVIDLQMIKSCPAYLPSCHGLEPPKGSGRTLAESTSSGTVREISVY